MLAGAIMSILLSVKNLHKAFKVSARRPGAPKLRLKAVDGVSFEIEAGETLGLVGESGCGKSTVGKLLLRLIEPDDGIIRFADKSVTGMPKRELTALRRDMQMIFQDPFSSLNPRMRIGEIIGEPLVVHDLVNGKDTRNQVLALMDKVGLSPAANASVSALPEPWQCNRAWWSPTSRSRRSISRFRPRSLISSRTCRKNSA
jgi:ABC-type oligopeptide transport system ATPase subunit